jgi:hypothetical protein
VSGNCKILDIWKGINLREADKNFRSAIEDSIPVKGFHHKVNRRLPHGPVLQKDIFNLGGLPVDIRKGSPITITKNNGPVVFDAHIGASRLYFIGQAGFGDLYPLGKRDSRVIAEYIVVYDDGGEFVIPIRNGIEITTILGSYGPSRIDPRAGGVSRVIKICYDLNWEVFYINLLEVELPKHGKIGSIKIKVNEEGITLLLYGITVV